MESAPVGRVSPANFVEAKQRVALKKAQTVPLHNRTPSNEIPHAERNPTIPLYFPESLKPVVIHGVHIVRATLVGSFAKIGGNDYYPNNGYCPIVDQKEFNDSKFAKLNNKFGRWTQLFQDLAFFQVTTRELTLIGKYQREINTVIAKKERNSDAPSIKHINEWSQVLFYNIRKDILIRLVLKVLMIASVILFVVGVAVSSPVTITLSLITLLGFNLGLRLRPNRMNLIKKNQDQADTIKGVLGSWYDVYTQTGPDKKELTNNT